MKQLFLSIMISLVTGGTISSQNVGINTDGNAPTELLHVKSTIASGSTLLIEHTIGTQVPALRLLTPTANADWRWYIPASTSEFRLSNTSTDRFTFLANGNLGIGNTIPAGRLDVKGSGNTNATYGFGVRNSADSYSFIIDDAGNVRLALIANGIVKTTGGTGTLSSGTVSLTSEITGTLPVGNGGTGATTLTGMLKGNGVSAISAITATQWGAAYWSDVNTLTSTAAGTSGQVLISGGAGAPTWSNRTMVNNTAGNWKLFYSNGTGVVTELALPAAGTVLTSAGAAAAPVWSVGATGSKILLYADETDATGFATNTNIKSWALPANTYTRIMWEADVQVSTTATGSNSVDFQFRITTGVVGTPMRMAEGAPANGNFVSDSGVFMYSQAQAAATNVIIGATVVAGTPTWYVNSFRIYGIK